MGSAAATTAISAGVEETDRMHITGEHKDSSAKTIKDKGTFREGTDHGKILKDAAIDGAAVLAGGAVGKAAQVVAKGSKAVKIGATVTGDVATGAVQEKIQTGDVTLSGTLMNAGMSGVGSAASTGALKDGVQKLKKAFGNSSNGVSKRFTVKKSPNNNANTVNQDPDADLDRFMKMGPLIARGTNDVPKQGFWSKLFGGKKSTPEATSAQNQSNTITYGGRTFKKATPRKSTEANAPGIEIVKKKSSARSRSVSNSNVQTSQHNNTTNSTNSANLKGVRLETQEHYYPAGDNVMKTRSSRVPSDKPVNLENASLVIDDEIPTARGSQVKETRVERSSILRSETDIKIDSDIVLKDGAKYRVGDKEITNAGGQVKISESKPQSTVFETSLNKPTRTRFNVSDLEYNTYVDTGVGFKFRLNTGESISIVDKNGKNLGFLERGKTMILEDGTEIAYCGNVRIDITVPKGV